MELVETLTVKDDYSFMESWLKNSGVTGNRLKKRLKRLGISEFECLIKYYKSSEGKLIKEYYLNGKKSDRQMFTESVLEKFKTMEKESKRINRFMTVETM